MGAVTSNFISIGELSRLSGVSPHTLRFYEAEGILMPAGRAANGHRRYHDEDVLWLEFVLRLKQTGMPLDAIRQYAALRAQGEKTLQVRRQGGLRGTGSCESGTHPGISPTRGVVPRLTFSAERTGLMSRNIHAVHHLPDLRSSCIPYK